MITYVNTVLVSNTPGFKSGAPAAPANATTPSTDAGKFILMNCDPDIDGTNTNLYTVTADTDTFKIGLVTSDITTIVKKDGSVVYQPVIKWSNEIKAKDIKSLTKLEYQDDSEDTVEVDFTNLTADVKNSIAQGGKIVVLRLTFKDMPTRFRNWTESYDYITKVGDDEAALATALAAAVNKATKRARVIATASGKKITFVAMPYDDDNSVDSINVANKVRFNVNLYWQDPNAAGFASSNKYELTGAAITKTPGVQYPASAKLVRDHESQAMGYLGILNRGEGTWPIIKPAMQTQLNGKYDGFTLEFENMYRAADDIFRKTKQTVEIYGNRGNGNSFSLSGLESALEAILGNEKILSGAAIENKEYGKASE